MVIATCQSADAAWDLKSHVVHDPAGSQLGSCCSPGHGIEMGMARSRATLELILVGEA